MVEAISNSKNLTYVSVEGSFARFTQSLETTPSSIQSSSPKSLLSRLKDLFTRFIDFICCRQKKAVSKEKEKTIPPLIPFEDSLKILTKDFYKLPSQLENKSSADKALLILLEPLPYDVQQSKLAGALIPFYSQLPVDDLPIEKLKEDSARALLEDYCPQASRKMNLWEQKTKTEKSLQEHIKEGKLLTLNSIKEELKQTLKSKAEWYQKALATPPEEKSVELFEAKFKKLNWVGPNQSELKNMSPLQKFLTLLEHKGVFGLPGTPFSLRSNFTYSSLLPIVELLAALPIAQFSKEECQRLHSDFPFKYTTSEEYAQQVNFFVACQKQKKVTFSTLLKAWKPESKESTFKNKPFGEQVVAILTDKGQFTDEAKNFELLSHVDEMVDLLDLPQLFQLASHFRKPNDSWTYSLSNLFLEIEETLAEKCWQILKR